MKHRFKTAVVLAVIVLAAACADRDRSSSKKPTTAAEQSTAVAAEPVASSPIAHERIAEIEKRFVYATGSAQRSSVLPKSIATSFEATHDGVGVRAILPAPKPLTRRAHVTLPKLANDYAYIEDETSHVSVRFALRGTKNVPVAVSDGFALYRGALLVDGGVSNSSSSDVVHRIHAEGTEDYVVFESRPQHEEISYDVDVSHVPGLRMIDNTNVLELVSEDGTPSLRIAPPFVVDAKGIEKEAKLAVSGCAYDVDSSPPWGRAVTRPGASQCIVHVSWDGSALTYPLIVDPSWTATGSMSTSRQDSTSTTLNTGFVLVTGGANGGGTTFSTAELYNPAGAGSFAATGSMSTFRQRHAASLLANGHVLISAGTTDGSSSGNIATSERFTGAAFALTGTMAAARHYHTSTLLNSGKVLITGGYVGITSVSTAEVWDPNGGAGSGTWGAANPMSTQRYLHTATLLPSGKVLVAGGTSTASQFLATAQIYDPGTNAFTATGSMSQQRRQHTATLLNTGRVLMSGGYGGTSVYVALGELFDPAAAAGVGAFANTGSMGVGRLEHGAVLLNSGKVLIATGTAATASNKTCELYNPATGTYSATAAVAASRAGPSVAKLANGKVLILGGVGDPTAEVYTVNAAGAACVIGDDCASGFCEDNICCSASAACSGTCMTCAAGTGACVAVTNADDASSCNGVNTCNAAGACRLKTGQACPGGAGTCATNNCADGFCCNSACTGGCDVCSATPGTCSIVGAGNVGASPSCAPFVCDGVSASCPTSCTNDASCGASLYCAANGTCQPFKANAAACNAAADCKVAGCAVCGAGTCADGVCCDTACTGLCQACTATLKQSGADGTCGPAKEGTNPHNDPCTVDLPATCGKDGKCSGSGGCRQYYPAGTSCGASTCDVASNKAQGQICNGSGGCNNDPAGASCGDYKCAGGSCPNGCTDDTQCSTTAYCKLGSCLPKAANGTKCTAANECTSASCVDGYCCNAACGGQCEACDITGAEGTCAPLSGAPHGARPACAAGDAANPCAASLCDGTVRESCAGFVGPQVTCGQASCASGNATSPGTCKKGTCSAPAPVPCGGYACGATACNTTCTKDGDCAAGNTCDVATSKCISGATCDGDHTTTGANGTKQDCAPFKCAQDGTCKQKCTTIDDCVAPTVCDVDGKCIVPPPTTSGEESGCTVSRSSSSSSSNTFHASWLVIATAIIVARRRRRSCSPAQRGNE